MREHQSQPDRTPGAPAERVDLSDRFGVVRVGGADAARFLQAQLSCDVGRLGAAHAGYGAYLSPQGRVLATLYVIPSGGRFLLLLHPSLVEATVNRLARYVLRDDVDFSTAAELLVSGRGAAKPSATTPDLSLLPIAEEPNGLRVELPDRRWLVISADGGVGGAADDWLRADLEQGIVAIEAATSDHHIPQALGLDRIGAISFNKGCFPGQEIVARVHYLGRSKRGLCLLTCPARPEPGTELLGPDGARAGQIVAAAREPGGGFLGLAVVAEAVGEPLTAAGEPVDVARRFDATR